MRVADARRLRMPGFLLALICFGGATLSAEEKPPAEWDTTKARGQTRDIKAVAVLAHSHLRSTALLCNVGLTTICPRWLTSRPSSFETTSGALTPAAQTTSAASIL